MLPSGREGMVGRMADVSSVNLIDVRPDVRGGKPLVDGFICRRFSKPREHLGRGLGNRERCINQHYLDGKRESDRCCNLCSADLIRFWRRTDRDRDFQGRDHDARYWDLEQWHGFSERIPHRGRPALPDRELWR